MELAPSSLPLVPLTLPVKGTCLVATFGSRLQLSSAFPESTSLCPLRGVRTALATLPHRSEPSFWATGPCGVMPYLRGPSSSFTSTSSDLPGSAGPSLSLPFVHTPRPQSGSSNGVNSVFFLNHALLFQVTNTHVSKSLYWILSAKVTSMILVFLSGLDWEQGAFTKCLWTHTHSRKQGQEVQEYAWWWWSVYPKRVWWEQHGQIIESGAGCDRQREHTRKWARERKMVAESKVNF